MDKFKPHWSHNEMDPLIHTGPVMRWIPLNHTGPIMRWILLNHTGPVMRWIPLNHTGPIMRWIPLNHTGTVMKKLNTLLEQGECRSFSHHSGT